MDVTRVATAHPAEVLKVPAWMVKAATGTILVLSVGTVLAVIIFLGVVLWVIALMGFQGREINTLREELKAVSKVATKERIEVKQAVEEVKKAVEEAPMSKKLENP